MAQLPLCQLRQRHEAAYEVYLQVNFNIIQMMCVIFFFFSKNFVKIARALAPEIGRIGNISSFEE